MPSCAYRAMLRIDVGRLTMIVTSDIDHGGLAQSEEIKWGVVADSSRSNGGLAKSKTHTQKFCSRVAFLYGTDAATRKHGHQK